jgi:hypothetical protein
MSARALAVGAEQQVLLDGELGKEPAALGHQRDAELTISSVELRVRSTRVPSSRAHLAGLGLTMPMMHLISVLLPLPLVPSSATVSPSRTSIDTPCSTRTAP